MRLSTAVAACVVVAVWVVAPHRMPGELLDDGLHDTGRPLCGDCPWAQQITGVGLRRVDDTLWLTTRFAVPPASARFGVLLGETGSTVGLTQVSSEGWMVSAAEGDGLDLAALRVAMRGDRVVWELPAAAAGAGIAVTSSAGRRFPATGVLLPELPATRVANGVDLCIGFALAVGAWLGHRRGGAAAILQLVVLVAVLVSARFLFDPVARVMGIDPRAPSAAFVYGGLLLGLTAAGSPVTSRPRKTIARWPRAAVRGPAGLPGPLCGVAAGLIWTTGVVAMALTLGSDLILLHLAHQAIDTSPTAFVLCRGWRALFPPFV